MVLIMENDGSLTPSAPQTSFARNYNEGIGQGSADDPLAVFGTITDANEGDEVRVAAIAPHNIEIESAYRQSAVSNAGAIGLGQLMPATARDLGVDPRDPQQNLDGSARYLAMMLELFGDPRLALAAYNAGPDAVRQYNDIPPYRETQNHVARVMAVVARLEGTNP